MDNPRREQSLGTAARHCEMTFEFVMNKDSKHLVNSDGPVKARL